MIPGKHRCPETTHTNGSPVQCRKNAGHEDNHWGLRSDGNDVVWAVHVLPVKRKATS